MMMGERAVSERIANTAGCIVWLCILVLLAATIPPRMATAEQTASVSEPAPITPPAPSSPNKISSSLYPEVGDELKMTVFGHDDLAVTLEVSPEGFISPPLLGNISIKEKTISDLTDEITALYNKDYLVDPKVILEISSYQPVFVMGQVNMPGSYQYESGLTVRKAVALAGGFTPRASMDSVKIVRKHKERVQHMQGDIDATLMPGDTLEIGRRWF